MEWVYPGMTLSTKSSCGDCVKVPIVSNKNRVSLRFIIFVVDIYVNYNKVLYIQIQEFIRKWEVG